MKYLITFEKNEAARWLGHLDVLRTFERAIRRAALPVAYSTGFNPREKIAFASALGVGITGARERATLELTEPIDPCELIQRLNDKLPPGIRLLEAEVIPEEGSRDLLNRFDRAEMQVVCTCEPGVTLQSAQAAVDSLLAQPRLEIEREREGRVKRMDVRPFIYSIEATELRDNRLTFTMLLSLGAEGSVRPAEIVSLLANELPGLSVRRIHRARLLAL
ncbi:MAG TPA: TIGR03936 family radical SAM-associated protein [Chthonomonadales bacterium]|nr:TIGR03936 family radical SAM-associated protein [Chthonomonadales bacterium]